MVLSSLQVTTRAFVAVLLRLGRNYHVAVNVKQRKRTRRQDAHIHTHTHTRRYTAGAREGGAGGGGREGREGSERVGERNVWQGFLCVEGGFLIGHTYQLP